MGSRTEIISGCGTGVHCSGMRPDLTSLSLYIRVKVRDMIGFLDRTIHQKKNNTRSIC